jgi:hypothetical protein
MNKAIAIAILGIALSSGGAAAQTAGEQAQILRDFDQSVADYAQRYPGLAMSPAAISTATPAPKVFTLPVALVFRQLIARSLVGHVGAPGLFGVGIAHRAMPLEPFPGTDLYDFPKQLTAALPLLPSPLEYRLIFNDLVIRDTQADVIVAVLRDAVGSVVTTR